MSNFMRPMVTNFDEATELKKEVMLDSWPMMGSPGPMLCIVGTYLAFVLKIGPKMMEKRPAMQLNSLLIAYNAFVVAMSTWMSVMPLVYPSLKHMVFPSKCNSSTREHDMSIQTMVANIIWWYFIAKVIELLDTVFFILRKKQNQVTFLHVYHHTSTTVFSWCYIKYLPDKQAVMFALLNSVVHIVMYTYYLIAALGPKYRKYLWWKKYMTTIQLTQFVIMLGYLMMLLAMDCKLSRPFICISLSHLVMYLYLFGDFYRKAYGKKEL